MQSIHHGSATLHISVTGPEGAPALVFSNSLGTDFRIWDDVLPLLPAGLRLLRYDKRGHGLSDCPETDWGVAEQISDLAAIMDASGISGAVVCGLSVGGLIAQGLAATRPDLARALILCDTGAKIGTEEMWNARIETISAGGIEALAEGILERWFTARFRAEDPSFPLWRNMLIRTPREGYLKTARGIRDTDLRASTAGLRLPALAICGDRDGATPPALVRELAGLIPGARYEEIADAGHLPCIEQPEVTARLISGFLGELGIG